MRRVLKNWFSDLVMAFRSECKDIIGDAGVLIFFLVLPLAYPLVYTMIYNPEVVTDLPIAVVDNSRTEQSRSLARSANASSAIKIYDYCNNMADAKRLMAERKVFGIMEIPADYSRNLVRGEQTVVPFYAEMSLLLRYRTMLTTLTDLQLSVIDSNSLPIENSNHFLGNPSQGFASFVMPGILILIIQQSMVIGICTIAGTARERRRRLRGSASAAVWGKTLCYVVLYIPLTLYAVHIVPMIFNLPHIGRPTDYLPFLLPMLFASAMFGQTLSVLCKERESSFFVVVISSILFIFLSGLTWPRYAMSTFFVWLGNLIPSTWGVNGFILINTNAATLSDVIRPYPILWILTILYSITATITTKTRK